MVYDGPFPEEMNACRHWRNELLANNETIAIGIAAQQESKSSLAEYASIGIALKNSIMAGGLDIDKYSTIVKPGALRSIFGSKRMGRH